METNSILQILDELVHLNQYGVAFLAPFGVSWIICGILWSKATDKIAGYATLFQGLVALPISLLISYLMGSFETNPGGPIFTQLITTIAMSQMLILPLIIVMVNKEQYTLVPFVFSASLTIHFVIYSWLYQTLIYIILSVLIAIGVAVIYSRNVGKANQLPTARGAAMASIFTGVVLLLSAIVFFFI